MNKEDLLNADFLKQFKTPEELNGFLQQLQKRAVEQMLEGEMDSHLGYEKHQTSHSENARNGHSKKKIKSTFGEAEIEVPRDRDGSFSPVLVPKRKGMAEGIEHVIISLYAKGMTVSDIEEQIRQVYNISVSTSTISRITDRITADITLWQNRPLEEVYLVLWMDAIVFKVRDNARVVEKSIYIALGLKKDGKKEVLGLWLGKTESASYWLSVLSDIKARGVRDILITVTDNLSGFTTAIGTVFPQATRQVCVVHQIRNSCKYVSYKDRQAFTRHMRQIYTAINRDAAELALEEFEKNWNNQYSYAIKSWRNNWDELTAFFDFPPEIRKIIYTTNIIENLNGKIRKYTSSKLSFPTDEAVLKSVYLAIMETSKRWTQSIANWGEILNQFTIMFETRLKI